MLECFQLTVQGTVNSGRAQCGIRRVERQGEHYVRVLSCSALLLWLAASTVKAVDCSSIISSGNGKIGRWGIVDAEEASRKIFHLLQSLVKISILMQTS